ncbi:MAG: molybdopterin-binding protein [Clostridia bacterium]
MKLIDTKNAIGHVLCHDLTRIIPGKMKDAQFRKGHIVTAEDIPILLSMGKEQLYILELDENRVHENDAAQFLVDLLINDNMSKSEVKEGKIELTATTDGLFSVNVKKLNAVNSIDNIAIATRRGNVAVKKGDKLAAMRIIPLTIEKEKLEQVMLTLNGEKILEVTPFLNMRLGLVTTGNEIFSGRIKDSFSPVVIEKLSNFGVFPIAHEISNDKTENIVLAVKKVKDAGANLVVCTGGMSVDPDDRTPAAIKQSGAKIISYGAPVFPGAMLLIGYFDDGIPILGLPGCVMYAKATLFDALLPRVLAGKRIAREDITELGNGGLCLSCEQCDFPDCPFAH